jgi:hypothetical protein
MSYAISKTARSIKMLCFQKSAQKKKIESAFISGFSFELQVLEKKVTQFLLETKM